MRIVTFSRNGTVQHGARIADRVRVHPTAGSAVDLAMNAAHYAAGEEIALADVTLLAPVPRGSKPTMSKRSVTEVLASAAETIAS